MYHCVNLNSANIGGIYEVAKGMGRKIQGGKGDF